MKETTPEHLVFVYGTLKRGFHNHHYLADAMFIDSAQTVRPYAMYVAGIPYVARHEPVSRIHGELFAVDEQTLHVLDQLESHPDWYCREQVEVLCNADNSPVIAWLYFNPDSSGRLIEDGMFRESTESYS